VDTGAESLAAYLRGRRVLVVLDNCEHILDACAELLDALLSRCGELCVVATSREALGIEGERVFRVPLLELETDAVRLFIDRARAAGVPVHPNAATEGTVTEICRRLDGIPLAIELAAARTTHMAPDQILERLADRFRLLTGGRRRVQRQQTLSAAIDWSYDLLSDDEQKLLSRLAVFKGSFSLQAVEEICDPDAVNLLASLVSKSLVTVQPEPAARYRLLETVRLYAEERLLASGEAAELRSAHRDWLLAWLESLPVAQLVWGRGEVLVPEADNLSAALDWSLEQDRPDLIARMASRMAGFWWLCVRIDEIAAWWRVLAHMLGKLPDSLRAAALLVGVEHATVMGDFEEMQRLSAEVLTVAAADSWVAAYAWANKPCTGRMPIPSEAGATSRRAANAPRLRMCLSWNARSPCCRPTC
jgi:predicted ATPase